MYKKGKTVALLGGVEIFSLLSKVYSGTLERGVCRIAEPSNQEEQ